jgi:TrmH family RNA methyltransferase
MLSKSELKYYSSLLKKKFREEENKFIAEGKRLVEEGLDSNFNCELICITNQFRETNKELLEKLKSYNIRLELLTERDLQKLCDTKTPQGIVAIFQKPKRQIENTSINDSPIIVALDQIRDPGNLGTIIRTCDWFGIKTIVLSESCVEYFSPKVVRSSMGSIFHLDVIENVSLPEWLADHKKNYNLLLADLNGNDIKSHQINKRSIIIFSNEAHGPASNLETIVDEKVTIKGKGKAESLNVASAAAIIISYMSDS